MVLKSGGADMFTVDKNGQVTTFNGTTATLLQSPGATQYVMQNGEAVELVVSNQYVDVTFPTAFSVVPMVVANVLDTGQSVYSFIVPSSITTTGVLLNMIGGDTAYTETNQWIAIGQ